MPNLLGSSIELESKVPQRIVVENRFLKSEIDEQIKGDVIGKRTLELILEWKDQLDQKAKSFLCLTQLKVMLG